LTGITNEDVAAHGVDFVEAYRAFLKFTDGCTTMAFGTDDLIYTTIFVLYGVFRYLYLIHASKQVENPTDALISDVPILANGTIWILACIYLIYFHGKTPLFP